MLFNVYDPIFKLLVIRFDNTFYTVYHQLTLIFSEFGSKGLEFFMILNDAHLHAVLCPQSDFSSDFFVHNRYCACTCSHDKAEFEKTEKLAQSFPGMFVKAFGLHPQNPSMNNADFLESLLKEKRISCIGECGFDFYTEQFKQNRPAQEEAWHFQIELAVRHSVPVVVHDRKALDLLFRDAKVLQQIPSVVFHSFAFGLREVQSLLNHGINAYFSFGKQILNGNKKSIECVSQLDSDRLLLETDAPFQTLKGESFTPAQDILRVYEQASVLRGISIECLCEDCNKNFKKAFLLTERI